MIDTIEDLKPGPHWPADVMDFRRAFQLAELIALRLRDRESTADGKAIANTIAKRIGEVARAWIAAE